MLQWERAHDGIMFGVCKGFARQFDIGVWLIRFGFIFFTLLGGLGFIFYLMLGFSMPNENESALDRQKKVLGVCYRLSQRAQMPVGLVRFLTSTLAFFSFGAVLVGYLVLFFLIPQSDVNEEILRSKTF